MIPTAKGGLALTFFAILGAGYAVPSYAVPSYAVAASAASTRVGLPAALRTETPWRAEYASPPLPAGTLSAAFTSWSPSLEGLPSRLGVKPGFETVGPPQLTLDYRLVPRVVRGAGTWVPRFGGSLLFLQRSAKLALGTGNLSLQQQSGFISTLRLGTDYFPKVAQSLYVRGFVGASLLPGFLGTSSSAFERGMFRFVLPVEMTVGALVPLPLAEWLGPTTLEVAGIGTLGQVLGASMSEFGFRAGVQVPL